MRFGETAAGGQSPPIETGSGDRSQADRQLELLLGSRPIVEYGIDTQCVTGMSVAEPRLQPDSLLELLHLVFPAGPRRLHSKRTQRVLGVGRKPVRQCIGRILLDGLVRQFEAGLRAFERPTVESVAGAEIKVVSFGVPGA